MLFYWPKLLDPHYSVLLFFPFLFFLSMGWYCGAAVAKLRTDNPPGGSEWIISVGDYVDNSFTALGSSDPREVRLEL